ncbi:hypothetical protein HJFPF1_00452 [Paramyrothecium foliicola]|nr:hypothetical protein HJFPF1_00452 [Paramyrothecium foliicola]
MADGEHVSGFRPSNLACTLPHAYDGHPIQEPIASSQLGRGLDQAFVHRLPRLVAGKARMCRTVQYILEHEHQQNV